MDSIKTIQTYVYFECPIFLLEISVAHIFILQNCIAFFLGGSKFWKNMFLFGGIPCLLLGMANVYINHEHDPRPEFIPYEYLRIRNKVIVLFIYLFYFIGIRFQCVLNSLFDFVLQRFPWGDGNKSLFHNPQINALPDGYEEEEHHH